jgi:hypothetical protein
MESTMPGENESTALGLYERKAVTTASETLDGRSAMVNDKINLDFDQYHV